MSAAANESRKRSKKRYGGPQHKRWRGPRELEVGMRGILITCNMNQRKCTAEAFNLLNEYADELYGPEKLHDNNGSRSEEDGPAEEEDMDVALRREVSHLRASGPKHHRRFQALESGANNVIFIKTQNLESDKLVHHILSDLHTTKKKKSRMILRMLPVTGTCRAYPEDMMRFLTTFLEPWFKTPHSATYQIAFKARNSSHNKREEMIKAIAGLVGKLNRKNRVNLSNPDLTIIVEVIKAVCCFSVVKDYRLYKKYNLQEIVKEDTPKPEVETAEKDSNTVEQMETEEANKDREEEEANKEKEEVEANKEEKEEEANKEEKEEEANKEENEEQANTEENEEQANKEENEEEANKEENEEQANTEENEEQANTEENEEQANTEEKEEQANTEEKEQEANKEEEEEKDCDQSVPEVKEVDQGERDGE
ncbi:THUMP domain-containing protein 1 [Antennarius striatus]|uniref:THUMP domain-containing protein 1 n=1 Tax=Antennarius striatus TaxID=241820 RepID=UPI0035B09094